MSGFEKILWYISIPASIMFCIQTLLTIVGATHDSAEVDVDTGAGDGGQGHFTLFTVRNLVIFMMMFGWTGIAMIRQFRASVPVTLAVAVCAGCALMFLVAFMFYGVSKLASGGSSGVDATIVGLEAKTYLKIPAKGNGSGKVTVVVNNIQKELSAMTNGPEIPTGTPVKILEYRQDGTVLVS